MHWKARSRRQEPKTLIEPKLRTCSASCSERIRWIDWDSRKAWGNSTVDRQSKSIFSIDLRINGWPVATLDAIPPPPPDPIPNEHLLENYRKTIAPARQAQSNKVNDEWGKMHIRQRAKNHRDEQGERTRAYLQLKNPSKNFNYRSASSRCDGDAVCECVTHKTNCCCLSKAIMKTAIFTRARWLAAVAAPFSPSRSSANCRDQSYHSYNMFVSYRNFSRDRITQIK